MPAIHRLPNEILYIILSHLDHDSLLCMSQYLKLPVKCVTDSRMSQWFNLLGGRQSWPSSMLVALEITNVRRFDFSSLDRINSQRLIVKLQGNNDAGIDSDAVMGALLQSPKTRGTDISIKNYGVVKLEHVEIQPSRITLHNVGKVVLGHCESDHPVFLSSRQAPIDGVTLLSHQHCFDFSRLSAQVFDISP